MEAGQEIQGFTLDRIREIAEQKAVLYEFRHIKSGAELIWLEREEENKTFAISFKTPPEDHTGLFHILEHCVLGGSRKYPVKEPFAELLKNSVNTFLNAMTFGDKTLYPFSSRHETDFFNLMDVYLDGVFNPALLENPLIFLQEGWHYAFDPAGKASYQGVVLNEMKGASSTLERKARQTVRQLLFPDSCYHYDSGGDPEHMVDLSYEAFKAAHARYYQASNARIFLDGRLPIEAVLAKLNDGYLCHFQAQEADFDIGLQAARPAYGVHDYEIGPDEDPRDKCRLTLARIVCGWEELEKQLALSILCDALAGSNEAPLKKVILERGLAQDFKLYLSDGVAQPWLGLEARNSSEDRFDTIKATLFETLSQLVDKGFNKADLLASLNQLHYQELDPEEPRGVDLAVTTLQSWLYGGDPALYLSPGRHYASLKEKIDSDYYERLAREVFLDQPPWVEVRSFPSPHYGRERDERERKRLAQESRTWSLEEKAGLVRQAEDLAAWQEGPDSPEALATLPRLSLEDLSGEPVYMESLLSREKGVTVLRHPSPVKGIIYMKLFFDLSDTPAEELAGITFLTRLLGRLPTRKRDAESLQREVKTHIGELGYALAPFSDYENPDRCKLYFTVTCSLLEDEWEQAVSLILEILTETLFDDRGKVRTLLVQDRERLRQATIFAAHYFAILRVRGHFTARDAAREKAGGFSYLAWVRAFLAAFEADWPAYRLFAQGFQERVFRRERLTLSLTGQKGEGDLNGLLTSLPGGRAPVEEYAYYAVDYPREEGVIIPSAVSYACLAADLAPFGGQFSGHWLALDQVLTLEHLWKRIRVQGGAYGAGFSVDRAALCSFYSYRDPSPDKSIRTFRASGDFLREFCAEKSDIETYILGKIGSLDPDLSFKGQADTADTWYFTGYDRDQALETRRELMASGPDQLLERAGLLDKAVREGATCLVGPEEAVRAGGDLPLIDIS